MRRHTHQMPKPTLPDTGSRLPCLYALYALRNPPRVPVNRMDGFDGVRRPIHLLDQEATTHGSP
jgi:hypothetical protein